MIEQPDKLEPETGFIKRWSRRKIEAKLEISEDITEDKNSAIPVPVESVVEEYKTDADMPPIDQLTEESDFSDFLSPGVSEALCKLALRKLFHLPFMNIVDGLDDYAEDYSSFAPLGNIIPQEMRRMLEREKAKEQAKEQEDRKKQEEHANGNENAGDVENVEIDAVDDEVEKTRLAANEAGPGAEHDQPAHENDLLKSDLLNEKDKAENEKLY